MNTTQLLLVSTVGLAVNLFGMFAMGGHAHHVSLWICHLNLFIDTCPRDILMVDMDMVIRVKSIKNMVMIPRRLAMFIMGILMSMELVILMITRKGMATRMGIKSMRLVLFWLGGNVVDSCLTVGTWT
jgi:Co/Zn/Cd efflux system component